MEEQQINPFAWQLRLSISDDSDQSTPVDSKLMSGSTIGFARGMH